MDNSPFVQPVSNPEWLLEFLGEQRQAGGTEKQSVHALFQAHSHHQAPAMFSRPAPTKGREPLGEFTSRWLIPSTEEPTSWAAAACQRRREPQGMLTEGFSDEVQLVHIGLARPQRDPGQQLGEDAADGPDVDGRAVLRVAHQQLRGAVPPGGHVVRVVIAGPSCRGDPGGEKQKAERDQSEAGKPPEVFTDVGAATRAPPGQGRATGTG